MRAHDMRTCACMRMRTCCLDAEGRCGHACICMYAYAHMTYGCQVGDDSDVCLACAYVRMCEMIGCQAHHRRPRRMAVLEHGTASFAWDRMQNVASVAVLLVSAMFQMWFSCGERRRSPNVRSLLLTFCGQGAKVCAAFILRKTAWLFCEGRAHGRPGHEARVCGNAVFARRNHHGTYINIRRAFCCASAA